MKLRMICATAVALFTLPGISQAQFNYTAIDLSYVDVELDVGPGTIDGDGFSIGGTYEIADSFFIGGSYEDASLDFNIDAELMEVGGGYFHTLNDDLDFIATFSYVDIELSSGGFSGDDDGLALGAGVRTALGESFEVEAMLEYIDFDSGGSDTGLELRGRYFFSDDIAVTGQVDLGKDIETLRIGIRFEF